jgi:hypothetical protein
MDPMRRKKPPPHPNKTRKTTQTTKQTTPKAPTWDEEKPGEPIPHKETKTGIIKKRKVVTTPPPHQLQQKQNYDQLSKR